MGLEDVVQGFQVSKGLGELAQKTDWKAYSQQVLGSMAYLGFDNLGFSEGDVQRMLVKGLNPEQIGLFANEYAPQVEKKFLEDTKANIKEILGNMQLDLLQQYGLKFDDKASEIREYQEALEKKDTRQLKELIANKTKDGKNDQDSPFNRLYLAFANEEQIYGIANRDLAQKAQEYTFKNFLKPVEGEEGKYEPDMEKAVDYIAKAVDKAGPEAYKEVAGNFYKAVAAAQSRQAAPDNAMAA